MAECFKVYAVTLLVVYLANFIASNANCPEAPDPCDPANHRFLNGDDDYTRSVSYTDAESGYLSDSLLLDFWYRATSGAGADMPTVAPDFGFCQAISPAWLNGNIPEVADGVQQRIACVKGLVTDCDQQLEICIKSCNEEYNVYYLTRPDDSFTRYCFGSELPCPAGEASNTGFTPCGIPPAVLENDPVLTVEKVISQINWLLGRLMMEFTCISDHSDATVDIEYQWIIDGVTIKTEVVTVGDQEDDPAVLSEQDLNDAGVTQLGTTIKCQVRPVLGGIFGDVRTTEMYAGVEAVSTQITVHEGGASVNYEFRHTVPLPCILRMTDVNNAEAQCVDKAMMVVPTIDGNAASCQNTDIGEQVLFETATTILDGIGDPVNCEVVITTYPYSANYMNETIKVPIQAKRDGLFDGLKEYALQMRMGDTSVGLWGTFALPNLFSLLELPRVQVTVVDGDAVVSGKTCGSYNDPHQRTFDGRWYELQVEGVVRMYRQITGIPIEVQAFFKRPYAGARYTHVCGVAVRSFGELYVNNNCGDRVFMNKFYQCDLMNVGGVGIQTLRVSQSGQTYTILLPTGGKVVVNYIWRHLAIYSGLSDYDNTEGACGTLNNNIHDDFKLRGTTTTTNDLNTFIQSWKISGIDLADSLFDGTINDEREFQDVMFCGCTAALDGNAVTNVTASCGATPVGPVTNCVIQGHDETDRYQRYCGLSKKKRETEFTDDLDDEDEEIDYDTNYVAPEAEWRYGWSQESAEQYCDDAYNTQSVNMCQDTNGVNVTANIETCVLDIKIAGSTEFIQAGINTIIDQCINEISRNSTLLTLNETTENGEVVNLQQQLLSNLCPADCSGQGQCVNGSCICDDDHTGFDCSEDLHHVPTLYDLPSSGMCDHFYRPCQQFTVYGDMFVEGANLTCRLQLQDLELNAVSDSTYSVATYEHFRKVFCPVPQSPPPYVVSIEVSNDNTTFSNSELLLVYDSVCWNCSFNDGCSKQAMSCIIDSVCYSEDETNPDNSDELCKPLEREYEWTLVTTTTSTTTASTPTGSNQQTTSNSIPTTTTQTIPVTTTTIPTTTTTTIPVTTTPIPTTANTTTTTTNPTTTTTSIPVTTTPISSTTTDIIPTTTTTTTIPTTTTTTIPTTTTTTIPVTTTPIPTTATTTTTTTIPTTTTTIIPPHSTTIPTTTTTTIPITGSNHQTTTTTFPNTGSNQQTTITTNPTTTTTSITTTTTTTLPTTGSIHQTTTTTIPATGSNNQITTTTIPTDTITTTGSNHQTTTTTGQTTTTATVPMTASNSQTSTASRQTPTIASNPTASATTNRMSNPNALTANDPVKIIGGISGGIAVMLVLIILSLFAFYKLKKKSDPRKAAEPDAEKHATPTQPEINREPVLPFNQAVNSQAALLTLIPSQPRIPVTTQDYTSRPASARSTTGENYVRASSKANIKDLDVQIEQELDPVGEAWTSAPPQDTSMQFPPKSKNFNFKQMRPNTGVRRNTNLPPLNLDDFK